MNLSEINDQTVCPECGRKFPQATWIKPAPRNVKKEDIVNEFIQHDRKLCVPCIRKNHNPEDYGLQANRQVGRKKRGAKS